MGARRRAVAVLAVGALAVTGCGRGGADDEVATVRELDLLGGAEQAGSARIWVRYELGLSAEEGLGVGFRTTGELEGVAEFSQPRSAFSGTMALTPTRPVGAVDETIDEPPTKVELRTIGPDSWERMWPEDEEPGSWHQSWSADEVESVPEGSVSAGGGSDDPAPTATSGGSASSGQDDEGSSSDPGASSEEGDEIYGQHGDVEIIDGSDQIGDEQTGDAPGADEGDQGSDPSDPDAGDAPDADLPPGEADDPGDASLFDGLDPTRLDPGAFLESLREKARSFTEEGTDSVRGASTTRYRAAVGVDPDGEDAALWSDDESEVGTVRVWLDDDEQLRRVQAGGLEMELWDFGVAVDLEPPTEVSDDDSSSSDPEPAEVVGPWAAETSGSETGRDWTVFAAPGRDNGIEVTCRTLEVAGVTPYDGGDDFGLSFPEHDGVPASCGASGAGFFGLGLGIGVVPDPAVQLLALQTDGYDDRGTLVGFAVSTRFRDAPVRLVREGADAVELALDGAGVAVWDPAGSPRVTAIELAGGDVRCAVIDPYAGYDDEAQGVEDPDSVEGSDEGAGEEDPGPDDEGVDDGDWEEPDIGLLYGVQPCVRT